jgi:hypothetical protein
MPACKMDLREMGTVGWNDMAEDMGQWRSVVNMEMNLWDL